MSDSEGVAYLACPYTHADPEVMLARFDAVNEHAARLIRGGQMIFSPVTHSHSLVCYGLPVDFAFWGRWNLAMLAACSRLIVLCLDGWEESIGIRDELVSAREQGKPIEYHFPNGSRAYAL